MNDAVWVSVSEVASQRGVSKQAVSKRLKSLGGRVSTRQDGTRLLVNLVEWDRVTGTDTDPAQDLRNRDVAPRLIDTPAAKPQGSGSGDLTAGGKASLAFSVQRAKRESYDAELARIKLEELQGKLVPVAAVENAMVRCATAILRVIDQMTGETEDPTLRKILKAKAHEVREALEKEMRLIAATDEDEG